MKCLFGCLSTIIGIVLVVVIGAVLLLGYFGFFPGVAGFFGSDKPKDLGVKYTQADVQSGNEKAKTTLTPLTVASSVQPTDTIKLSGSTPVNATFTDEELNGLLASRNGKWKYSPLSSWQMRINNDGTVESSGIIQLDHAYGYASATGIPKDIVDTVVEKLEIGNINPPFYVKGTATVTNNKVTADVTQLEIGRFTVPGNLIAENKLTVVAFLEDRIKVNGMNIKSLTFSNGTMKLDGTVPESVSLAPPDGKK